MSDLFDEPLFDESLFDDLGSIRVRAEAFGRANVTCIPSAILTAAAVAYGTSRVEVTCVGVCSAVAIAWGHAFVECNATRIQNFPSRAGFRVQRWGGIR